MKEWSTHTYTHSHALPRGTRYLSLVSTKIVKSYTSLGQCTSERMNAGSRSHTISHTLCERRPTARYRNQIKLNVCARVSALTIQTKRNKKKRNAAQRKSKRDRWTEATHNATRQEHDEQNSRNKRFQVWCTIYNDRLTGQKDRIQWNKTTHNYENRFFFFFFLLLLCSAAAAAAARLLLFRFRSRPLNVPSPLDR